MYCKSCGKENSNLTNYCTHDGVYLKNTSVKYRLTDRSATFCSSCGTSVKGNNNYCPNCGKELQVFTKQVKPLTKIVTPLDSSIKTNVKISVPAFKLEYLKKSLIPAIISLVLLLAFSFFIVTQIDDFNSPDQLLESALEQLDLPYGMVRNIDNFTDPDRVAEYEEELEYYLDRDVDVRISSLPEKFFNFADFALISNLQNSRLNVNMDMNIMDNKQKLDGELIVKNGFLVWLLVPFIALFIGGVVSGRMNQKKEPGELFYQALSIAFIYSIVLVILTFFAGFTYEVGFKGGKQYFSLDIATSYSIIQTFVTTFILALVFSGFGALFAIRFRKITGHLTEMIPYGESIHQAISTVARGLIVMFTVLAILLYKKIGEFNDSMGYFLDLPEDVYRNIYLSVLALSTQLSSYVWNLTHLAPIKFLVSGTGVENGSLTYRIFSGFKMEDKTSLYDPLYFIEAGLASTNIELYLKLAILLPVLFFMWSGYRISLKHGQSLVNTLVYSFTYAFLMFMLALVSDLGLVGEFMLKGDENESGKMMTSLGFNPFVIFVLGFIFSMIFAYAGSYIYKLKISKVVSN